MPGGPAQVCLVGRIGVQSFNALDRRTRILTYRQTYRHTDRRTVSQTDRQTDRETDRERDREKERQRDWKRERSKERQAKSEEAAQDGLVERIRAEGLNTLSAVSLTNSPSIRSSNT